MSRGFGATYGVGTTDAVQVEVLATVLGSMHVWTAKNGIGGGTFGGIQWGGDAVYTSGSGILTQLTYSTTYAEWSGAYAQPMDNTWHSIGLSRDATLPTTPAVIYADGVSLTITNNHAGSGTYTGAGPRTFIIGNNTLTGGIRNWDGRIGEMAFWNCILTATEFAALARGVPAYLVRPGSLTGYFPLSGPHHPGLDLNPYGNTINQSGIFGLTGTKLHADPPRVARNRIGINSRQALAQGNFPTMLPMRGPVQAPAAIFGYTNSPMGSIRRTRAVIGY